MPRVPVAPHGAPCILSALLVWQGQEGWVPCGGLCACGTDLLVHSQTEEVAQEAVEEPLVEPLLEPEGENYEEPPQVRGQGGTVDAV